MINIGDSNIIDEEIEDFLFRIRKMKYDVGKIESIKIRQEYRKIIMHLENIKVELLKMRHDKEK